MTPYELSDRVTLQYRVDGKDSSGAILQAGVWVNFVAAGDGKVWARVRDMTGRQFVAAGGTQNEVQTQIEIRHRPGIVAAMRVLHCAEVYDIKTVLDQQGKALLLMCAKGVNRG